MSSLPVFAIAQDASSQKYLCFDSLFRQGDGFMFGRGGDMQQPEIYDSIEEANSTLTDYLSHFTRSAACVVEVEICGTREIVRFLKFKSHTR